MRAAFLIGLIFFLSLAQAVKLAAQTFPAVPAAPASSLRDAALRDWLRQNWYDGKRTVLSYSAARAKLYNYVDNQQGLVRCVYSGYTEAKPLSFSSTSTTMQNINCEHTVPQSWFNEVERMRSDIHHLFPTVIQWNSDRGSDPFADISDAQTTKWIRGLNSQTSIPTSNINEYSEDTNTQFEPREDHKGNLARAVFYFYTMHANQTFISGKNVITAVGDLNMLYQWHLADPVDAQEQERNRRAAASQGNYNPYINDPSLVARAWGFQTTGTSPTVQFAAASGTQAEGSAGTASYVVTVTLTAEPSSAASVQVALDAGGTTATASTDYTFTSPQTLSFGPGLPLTRTVTVTVNGDATVEPDETVQLLLQTPAGPLTLGTPTTHSLTITNDDVTTATPTLNFASASATTAEGNSGTATYTVTVSLSPAASGTVTVPIEIDAANTSADAADYTLTTTSLTFTAGVTSRSVNVTVQGDATVEPDEVVRLLLGTPTGGAARGSTTTHSLTLRNDDVASGGGTLACGGLFFSEYIESTSGSNKAVEIYNPSDQPVNLAGYQVQLFTNGSSTATATHNLSGTLGGREVYVIINNQSTDANFLNQGDAISGVTNFNGNDALVLSYNTTTLDVIGVKGVDPGTSWAVPGGSTEDFTLIRNATVKQGQTNWTTAATEWSAVGANVYSYLGQQTANECSPSPMPVTLLHFGARRTGPATVQLSWQTAQELGNDYFELEKSADGQVFRPIGRVAGSGTTASARAYQLADPSAAGAAYYRLRQVDYDGRATRGPVAFVPAPAAAPGPQLYPNPTTGAVTLAGLPAGASLSFVLRSAHGRMLLQVVGLSAAEAGAALSTALSRSVPGVYVLTVEADGQRHFVKVVRQ
ncbi:endonuclease [Hymenobacter sp. BT175]|uniref:endonuclease n=1 Tax=Hymenobacter translucens TaxID=2886507 RepID=UPI001D0F3D0C|nr:endonuclease [Hymenobacter translucens]MCC2548055.1 endonuclease [Hymenobacter translucens]